MLPIGIVHGWWTKLGVGHVIINDFDIYYVNCWVRVRVRSQSNKQRTFYPLR